MTAAAQPRARVARSARAPEVPPPLWEAVRAHCEACAPEEAVGVLLEHPDGWQHRPLRNAYNAQRALEPEGWPRSNRTAFLVAPRDWMALEDEAQRTGARIAVLYHSHIEAPAVLSAEDLSRLRPGGESLVRGLRALVVEVRSGRAVAAATYTL